MIVIHATIEYIKKHKAKGFRFSIILDSQDSYKEFLQFLKKWKSGEFIKKIYIVNHYKNLRQIINLWKALVKLNVPLDVMWMNVPLQLKYKPSSRWSQKEILDHDETIPFLDVISSAQDAELASKCNVIVMNSKVHMGLYSSKHMLQAHTVWMQKFDVTSMIEGEDEFTEMLKDTIEKFVLYSSINKYNIDLEQLLQSVTVEPFKDLDLVYNFANGYLPNLKTFEVSLYGFSLQKLIKILELNWDKQLNIDMYEVPGNRNFIATENVVFFFKYKMSTY